MKYGYLAGLFLLTSFHSAGQNKFRRLDELTKVNKNAWPSLAQLFNTAKNKVEVLQADTLSSRAELLKMQVSLNSSLGCLVFMTGGVLVDDGWIRIIGSGSRRMERKMTAWNEGKTLANASGRPLSLLIADDAIGGFFLLNEGEFGTDTGSIYYLSPDNLEYEPLGIDYTGFIYFCCNNDLEKFYEGYRWKTWRKDVSALPADKMFHFYPYLFTKEGKDIEHNERGVVPVEEQYSFTIEMSKQLLNKK